MKKNILNIVTLFLGIFFLGGCGEPKNPLYRVDVSRVPVMQFLKVTDGSESSCSTYPYCQQFPARPNTRLTVKFVMVSPQSIVPTVEIKKISYLDGSSVLGSSSRSAYGANTSTACELSTTDVGLAKNTAMSRVIQDAPLRIEEVAFNITIPTWTALISKLLKDKCFPAFRFEYSSSSSTGEDKGIGTIFLLPESTDTTSWDTLKTSLQSAGAADERISATLTFFQTLAVTNNPPRLSGITTSSNEITVGNDNEISAQLVTSADPDTDAKTRFQWFITNGKLNNMQSKTVKWNPTDAGSVGAFVMVRDLQGGVDYRYVNLTAR